MPRQTQRQCGPLRGKQADASAQDHRHDRELVNVDEVKRHHPAGELRAAAHPDIPPGARFQAAYRLVLLAFIGGKMLWEAFTEDEDEGDGKDAEKIDLVEYLILAIATSIDALAVGISFAALSVDIVPAVSLIGVTTFIFSVAGVAIGHTFGARYEKPATIVGGVVLILIGLKILLEHLGILVL